MHVFIVSVFAVGHGRKSIFGARVDLRVGQPANASHEQRSLSSSLPDQRIAPRVEYRQHDNPLFFRLEKYRVRKTTPMVIYRSSIQAGLDGGFNLPPGNDIIRVCVVVGKTAVELGALRFCQRCGRCNAVPQLFNKRQALRDTEPFDT